MSGDCDAQSDLLSSYTGGVLTRNAALVELQDSEVPYNLITFLSAVQWRGVDILPISWHPGMDTAGRGFTSNIQQSMINLAITFVFKRYVPPKRVADAFETYRALVSEVCILGHPAIREHPNIIRLEGICWDVLSDDKVWPVLVFEKTKHGNLAAFLLSDVGKGAGMDARVKLCADLTRAVAVMHSCSIIHGDLKPENILVSEDNEGTFTAKVCDFGYSTLADRASIIRLPSTQPWAAPEYHRGGFEMNNAKKLDCYSVGLVCFWALFFNLERGERSDAELRGDVAENDEKLHLLRETYDWIRRLKIENGFQGLIHSMKEDDLDLQRAEKQDLETFFQRTLDVQPEGRASELIRLLPLLQRRSLPNSLEESVNISAISLQPIFETFFCEHFFTVSESILSLISANHRVRDYVVDSLRNTASQGTPVSAQAEFELALCYRIGFGVRRDLDAAQALLHRSKRSQRDLDNQISRVKDKKSFSYHNENVTHLSERGLLRTVDHVDEYRKSGLFDTLEEHHLDEIGDMKETFHSTHPIVRALQLQRAQFARNRTDLGHAEAILESVLEDLEQDSFNDREAILFFQGELGLVLRDMGKFQRARQVLEGVVKGTQDQWGEVHPTTLVSSNYLASVLVEEGNYESAQKLYERIRAGIEGIFGIDHPETATASSNLSGVLRSQGKNGQAAELAQQALAVKTKILGAEHSDTLTALANLAVILKEDGNYEAAEEKFRQSLRVKVQFYGEGHQSTLTTINNLALLLAEQGKLDAAEEQFQKVITGTERLYGRRHLATQTALSNLATISSRRGHYEKAECINREVYEISKLTLGEEHPNTITSASNLAITLKNLHRYEEAEAIFDEYLEKTQRTLGDHHRLSLSLHANLATLYFAQMRLQKAEELYRYIVPKSIEILGEDHPSTFTYLANQASVLQDQGKYSEAEDSNRRLLEKKKTLFGPNHPATLQTVNNLASVLQARGEYVEAGQMANWATQGAKEVLGPHHPLTQQSQFLLMMVENAVAK